MSKACFDKSGFLVWLSKGSRHADGDADHIVLDVPDDADPNVLFYDGSNVIARDMVEVQTDKLAIVSDGTDAATITGLPDPCCLSINGEHVEVTGGTYTVTLTYPSSCLVELAGAHRSSPIVIRSDTADNLLNQVRDERDKLLASSDWTQGRDCKMDEDKQDAWAAYRQALRDLPEAQPTANITTAIWPTPPM